MDPKSLQGTKKKRPPIEQDATPKCKRLKKKISDKKETTPKYKGLRRKTFVGKRGNKKKAKPKSKQDRQFTEASFAHVTVKGEGDAFWLGKCMV
jgi:hypothetical protein